MLIVDPTTADRRSSGLAQHFTDCLKLTGGLYQLWTNGWFDPYFRTNLESDHLLLSRCDGYSAWS